MPISPALQRFVDDELERSTLFVSRVLAGTLQLLGEAKDGAPNATERSQCIELIAALQQRAAPYQRRFIESLGQQVASDLRGPGDLGAEAGVDAASLALMDETQVEVDIEISRAMQLIDTTAEWELRELQTFTSTLAGRGHVSAESNPFRPLVYAGALWQAACAVAAAQAERATLLRLSSGVAAGLLKSAWAAACGRLESQGVEPGTYRTVVLTGGGRTPSVDVTRPGALGGLLSKMPDGSPDGRLASEARSASPIAVPGPGERSAISANLQSAEFEAALRRLDNWLRRLSPAAIASLLQPAGTAQQLGSSARLRDHRAALVASAARAHDRQVIELLSRIFETILCDAKLGAGFRTVIARLQVAALRVALHDPALLETHDHAVWLLIDRIGAAGGAHPRPDDRRGAALESFSRSVAEEIACAAAPDAALFRHALNRIDGFLADQLNAERAAAQPAVAALELAERRDLLEQHLSQRLIDQIAALRTSPGMRRFVTTRWARVIAEATLRFGEDAEPTGAYLKTVDDLLWSLRIPDHPQSRQRLVALLPALLQRLRAGMEMIAMPEPERQAVLDELMAIHAEALRPGPRAGAQGLTSQRIVQRMRDEVVADVPGPRGFSDSVIDLSSMDTVPADLLATGDAAADDPGERIELLRVADCVRLFIGGGWTRCQLLWRSEQGLFFLFAGDNPGRTHSITRRALERLAEAGLVQGLEAKPLLQRAVDHLMREIAARP